jgi:flagellin-specific chaperone FliS
MEEQLDQQRIDTILKEYEDNLSFKWGGNTESRIRHTLSQYKQIADNAIWQAKQFLEDSKTQYKALEIIVEGLTDEGLNHGQKRVIANHIIRMLRSMVDKLDSVEYKYETNMLDRFNFFRSRTPESRLFEAHKEMKGKIEQQDALLKKLKEKHPEAFDESDEIPF